MECKDARALIGAGGTGEEPNKEPSAHLRDHLAACEACREHARLWELLGEAGALERGLDFTERVVARLKAEGRHSERHGERRGPWGWLQAMLAPRPASTRTLDEFADFPPESFGALLFGRREARE